MKTATLLGGPYHLMNRDVSDPPPPYLMLLEPALITPDRQASVKYTVHRYDRDGDVYGTDQPQYRYHGGDA